MVAIVGRPSYPWEICSGGLEPEWKFHAVFGIRATYCCHMRPVVLRRGEHLLVADISARDQGHVKAANKCRSERQPRDRWDSGRRQPKGRDVSNSCSTDSSSLSLHACLARAKVSTETSEGARLDSRSTFLSKLQRRLAGWRVPPTSTYWRHSALTITPRMVT